MEESPTPITLLMNDHNCFVSRDVSVGVFTFPKCCWSTTSRSLLLPWPSDSKQLSALESLLGKSKVRIDRFAGRRIAPLVLRVETSLNEPLLPVSLLLREGYGKQATRPKTVAGSRVLRFALTESALGWLKAKAPKLVSEILTSSCSPDLAFCIFGQRVLSHVDMVQCFNLGAVLIPSDERGKRDAWTLQQMMQILSTKKKEALAEEGWSELNEINLGCHAFADADQD